MCLSTHLPMLYPGPHRMFYLLTTYPSIQLFLYLPTCPSKNLSITHIHPHVYILIMYC